MSSNDNELTELIQQSATEDLDLLEPVADVSNRASALNHPKELLIAWMFCLAVATYYLLGSNSQPEELGFRDVDSRLSVALYHVAYRIEVYRLMNQSLPDYLEPEWTYKNAVKYTVGPDGYQITGSEGEHKVTYREGEDPERLIHHFSFRLPDA